jgi:hypothetical protein
MNEAKADGGSAGEAAGRLRRLLLALFVFGSVGVVAELGLLGHYEDYKQYIPLVLLALGLPAAGWLAVAPGRGSVVAFRGLMVLFVAGGIVGLVLHYRTNAEFELEIFPVMGGWELFWESLRGATPALAPGTMVELGLLGLLATFRHPAASRSGASASTTPPTRSQGDYR